jgi:hypothetical protein
VRVDRAERNGRPAPKAQNHSLSDTPEAEESDPDTHVEGPENYGTRQMLDGEETEDTHIRRSNRKVRQPSRFANAVMVGLRIGKLFHTDPIWDTLSPHKELPQFWEVTLEQDMTSFRVFSRNQRSTR